jgi:hypothetical protein
VTFLRLAHHRNGKRQSVVIVREGNSVGAVFKSEGAAPSPIKSHIGRGTLPIDPGNSAAATMIASAPFFSPGNRPLDNEPA